MMRNFLKLVAMALVVVLSGALFCHAGSAGVKTDKTTYNYGEKVKVTFSGAPGLDRDWITIVPADSPDTEGGDYKYMPKGAETGSMVYDSPAPGKYEVRAFYNYDRVGYKVAARSAFAVTGDAAYKEATEQQYERKLDPKNPVEAKVPSGKGLVYIYREPWSGSAAVDLQVLCNDKPMVLGPTDYYALVVDAGEYRCKTGSLFKTGTTNEVAAGITGNATVKVKPGSVYYLRAKVMPFAYYDNYLDNMPHQEGADAMVNYNLKQRK